MIFMLTQNDGKTLLKLARSSIESEFSSSSNIISGINSVMKENLKQKQGAFVTLTKKGALRGCIGFTAQIYPLCRTIELAAKAAAFEDPRFPPLSRNELRDVHLEISVLTIPEEIMLIKGETKKDIVNHIEIGKDGLIVQYMGRSGLLLPQVFTEWRASPSQAIEMTCEKAGLQKDVWLKDGCKVFKFQAQVFRE